MSKDETPPHVTALFDQQRATQKNEDKMPEGVIAQVRIRRVEAGEGYSALVASFMLDVESLEESAALLITLEEVATTFGKDVSRKLAERAVQGPDGMMEMMRIVKLIMDARNTKVSEVKKFSDGGES